MELNNEPKLGLELRLTKPLLLLTILSGLTVAVVFIYSNLMNSSDSMAGTQSTGTFSCVGPAGIGDGTTNRFCFTFDSTGLMHNDAVSTVTNEGGNGTPFTQSTSSSRPVLLSETGNMNGHPVLRFDGSDDYLAMSDQNDLNKAESYERSFNIVVRTSFNISDRQVIYEEGGTTRGINIYLSNSKLYLSVWNKANDGNDAPWSFFSVDTTISTNEEYIITMVYDGSNDNSTSGRFIGYLNGAHFGTANGIGKLYAHGDDIGLGAMNKNTVFENGNGNGNGYYFEGDVAALIMYNYALDSAERTILENHMSSRFDIAIQNDLYSHDATGHHHNVAGIGRSNGDMNNCAAIAGLIEVSNPSDLDVGEYLIFGHDIDTGATESLIPSGIYARWKRQIRFEETGNVGTVDLTISLNQLNFNITDGSAMRLLVDEDGDGDLSDAQSISGTYNSGEETLTFTGVTVADNYILTLGTTSSANALPVEFIGVSAEWEGDDGLIKWSTAMEENNSHFIIERTHDGAAWEEIGEVAGAGNSAVVLDYSYIDMQPYSDVNFYRIKQVDFDGKFDYSRTVMLNSMIEHATYKIKMFPNPAQDVVTLSWNGERSGVVRVLNIAGTEVQRYNVSYQSQLQLNVSTLPNGNYIVDYNGDGGELSERLIVRH